MAVLTAIILRSGGMPYQGFPVASPLALARLLAYLRGQDNPT
jgi:hypothetical protein